MSTTIKSSTLKINAPHLKNSGKILTDEAVEFLVELNEKFNSRRKEVLAERAKIQDYIDQNGTLPGWDPATEDIRNGDWQIGPIKKDIRDRAVEITGPVERKMIINALNSGARVFMADFEDSNTPSWENQIQGQINLMDAIRKTISYSNPENGKTYELNEKVATLMVRPRGWHMEEKHLLLNGEPVSGSLVDFGLYFFHNAKELIERGSAPYFYLPKMEHSREAKLWDDVFTFSEEYLGIEHGTIKGTVLVETIPAVFQLHEILYALKDHSAGLNCGRWDYIFSFIKRFKNVKNYVFPDRSQITMTVPNMRAYTQLVIQTCHQHGAHAIGGMAAQIPIKNDPEANEAALTKVHNDKLREVLDGHDGTWVAHPALVPVAKEVFEKLMTNHNQIDHKKEFFKTSKEELLALPEGTITEAGLRMNINVGILYIESWLRGNGAAAIYNLMEDAATAEISRTQVWQWLKNNVSLDDGRKVDLDLYHNLKSEEIEKIKTLVGAEAFANGKFDQAISLFDQLVTEPTCEEFLTTSAYKDIE